MKDDASQNDSIHETRSEQPRVAVGRQVETPWVSLPKNKDFSRMHQPLYTTSLSEPSFQEKKPNPFLDKTGFWLGILGLCSACLTPFFFFFAYPVFPLTWLFGTVLPLLGVLFSAAALHRERKTGYHDKIVRLGLIISVSTLLLELLILFLLVFSGFLLLSALFGVG